MADEGCAECREAHLRGEVACGCACHSQRFLEFRRQGTGVAGGWAEAIRCLNEAQRLMELMAAPAPGRLEMDSVGAMYRRAIAAMVESIRWHYEVTLRIAERTPVRVVVDDAGIHVERDGFDRIEADDA